MRIEDLTIDRVQLKHDQVELICPTTMWPVKLSTKREPRNHVGSPVDPPGNYYQCHHVEAEYDKKTGEFVRYIRCTRDSTIGFLCRAHDTQVFGRKVVAKPQQRDHDDEIVEDIKHTERRAIARLELERVRLTTKGQFITYAKA